MLSHDAALAAAAATPGLLARLHRITIAAAQRLRRSETRGWVLPAEAVSACRRSLLQLRDPKEVFAAGASLLMFARQLEASDGAAAGDQLVQLLAEAPVIETFLRAGVLEVSGRRPPARPLGDLAVFIGAAQARSVRSVKRPWLTADFEALLHDLIEPGRQARRITAADIPKLQRILPRQRALMRLDRRQFSDVQVEVVEDCIQFSAEEKVLVRIGREDLKRAATAAGLLVAG